MEAAPRQVIVVITDTTRWDMLHCYRETGVQTPQLDRLAASGVRFERAYTCSPVCAPARSALLTGLWPHSNGVWSNDMPLGQNIATIGERASAAGIHSGYIGKWHLDGTDYFGDGKCPRGWDPSVWFDGRTYLEELSDTDRVRSRLSDDPRPVASSFTYAHRCTDRAIGYVEQHRDQDFLLVVSYDEPHGPSLCPPEFSDPYRDFIFPSGDNAADSLADKPVHQRIWADGFVDGNPARSSFFGAQTFVDDQIGRLLNIVDQCVPDSLIIYTSDHGDALGSHRLAHKGPAMYDEIARIPLLIRGPRCHASSGVVSEPVSHIDLAPTVLEFLDVERPEVLEGRSLLPALADTANDSRTQPVFVEFGRYEVDHDGFGGFQPMRGILHRKHKLVINLLSDDELYDLESDPAELINLISSDSHRSIRDRMHELLLDWMHETRDPFRGYQWQRRPWCSAAAPSHWAGRGLTRQIKNDTLRPRALDYDTGLPMLERERRKVIT